jgi:hypothetical protein
MSKCLCQTATKLVTAVLELLDKHEEYGYTSPFLQQYILELKTAAEPYNKNRELYENPRIINNQYGHKEDQE